MLTFAGEVTMTIDRLIQADASAAVRTLSAAFSNYPLIRAIAPAPWSQPRVCDAFCRMIVNYIIREGVAYGTADRTVVACWLPPNRGRISWSGLLRSGVLSLGWELGLRGVALLERLGRQIEAIRFSHVPGPHWYLMLLGAHPTVRGRGLTRAVLQPVFEAADRARLPCYLETQDGADVPIHRRLGFALAGGRRLPGGLRNWEMRRDPGEGASG
jgi:GNAT superfamily N-acetyltransferase